MSTNYYVAVKGCPDACTHCAGTEQIHLGKSSSGWQFLFYADPNWPRDEAFAYWVRRALSGHITSEYGRTETLTHLLGIVEAKRGLPPCPATAEDMFTSSGYHFSDREFS